MFLRKDNSELTFVHRAVFHLLFLGLPLLLQYLLPDALTSRRSIEELTEEDVGLLVPLGFDITAFTPVAYQRGSLPRPSKDVSS